MMFDDNFGLDVEVQYLVVRHHGFDVATHKFDKLLPRYAPQNGGAHEDVADDVIILELDVLEGLSREQGERLAHRDTPDG